MFHEPLKVLERIGIGVTVLSFRNDVKEFFFEMDTCHVATFELMIGPVGFLAGFATVPGSFTAAAFHGMDVLAVRAIGITAEVDVAHG